MYLLGIYSDSLCSNEPSELNHAVLAVGYGTENGQDYWILKNRYCNLKSCSFNKPYMLTVYCLLSINIIIWKAQRVPQYNYAAHPKHQEKEETPPNRNLITIRKR